jgi:amidase
VRDTAHVCAGTELAWHPKRLPPIGLVEGPDARRLRIGLVTESINGAAMDQDTSAAAMAAADLLSSLGHQVNPIALPVGEQFAEDFAIYWGMLAFILVKVGKRALSPDFDLAKLDPVTTGLAEHYRRHRRQTAGMVRRLRQSTADYARMFDSCDVVLSPVLAHTTPEIGYLSPHQPFDQLFDRLLHYVAFTPFNNVSGGPAISLPMGQGAGGLPVGVQFAAKYADERTLLALAYEIEEAQPWRRIQDAAG